MFGVLFGNREEKPEESGKEVGKPTEEDFKTGLGHLGLALLNGTLCRPKTYERLIHDLYVAGWTIEEVKTLLNGGKIEETQAKNEQ